MVPSSVWLSVRGFEFVCFFLVLSTGRDLVHLCPKFHAKETHRQARQKNKAIGSVWTKGQQQKNRQLCSGLKKHTQARRTNRQIDLESPDKEELVGRNS